MKYLIAADIHGSAFYCEQLLDRFEESCADKLILLGDILYHGPRNELPFGYEPTKVIDMLNALSDRVFCIRGNCDCEVDQMVLRFPIMADYAMIPYGEKTIFLTHGHKYGKDTIENYCKAMKAYEAAKENGETAVLPDPIPALNPGDVLLQGHTHVSMLSQLSNDVININPGSVSIPKGGTSNGYLVFEDGIFTRYTLNGIPEFKYDMNPAPTFAETAEETTEA